MKLRTVVLMGLVWGVVVVGFQWLVQGRFAPQPPDEALNWTPGETSPGSQVNRPYLLEPVMNDSVAWDSEYYLSIAISGYDDDRVGKVFDGDREISKNYAFFPLYPVLVKIVALPFKLFAGPIAAASIAGVIVSVAGAIVAACALFLLVGGSGTAANGNRAWKTSFYLLVFPASFFMAQVYTEGLFLGLVFATFALIKSRKIGWASLLAVLAVWTKVVGVCLVVPLVWSWLEIEKKKLDTKTVLPFLYALAPVAAFLLWHFSPLGRNYDLVEALFFNRKPLNIQSAVDNWSAAFVLLFTGSPQTRAYYLVEFAAIVYGIAACVLAMKESAPTAVFGLLVILLSLSSGAAQGMHRYVLAAPPVFTVLGRWGARSELFDRWWTLVSALLFGLLLTCYTLNMWVG